MKKKQLVVAASFACLVSSTAFAQAPAAPAADTTAAPAEPAAPAPPAIPAGTPPPAGTPGHAELAPTYTEPTEAAPPQSFATTSEATTVRPRRDRWAYRHYGSFFGVWTAPGYLTTAADVFEVTHRFTGPSMSLGLQFGGAMFENCVFYAEGAVDRTLTARFTGANGEHTSDYDSIRFVRVGAGLAYYLMPYNVHVDGVASIVDITMGGKVDSKTRSANYGYGFTAKVGKEWFVTPHLGVGAVAMFSLGVLQDQGYEGARTAWKFRVFSLGVNTAFN